MSYRLEYQYAAFRVEDVDTAVPRYVVAIEGGDNNLWNDTKRHRSWSVCMLGTQEQVIKQTVMLSGSCYGASLRPNGRPCSPQAYIRRIQRLIARADQDRPRASWSRRIKVRDNHPLLHAAATRLPAPRIEQQWGSSWAVFNLPAESVEAYWALVDQFCGYDRCGELVSPHAFAEIWGLPQS